MSTTMIYHSSATKKVKPDVANLFVALKSQEQTPRAAVEKINEDRELIKQFAESKGSFKSGSYQQMNVDVTKKTRRIQYYHCDAPKFGTQADITVEQYNRLGEKERALYTPRYRDEFLYWEASLNLSFTLEYVESIVDDIVAIFNMCTEKEFRCTYDITVAKEMRNSTEQALYVDCINSGVSTVRNIVSGIEHFKGSRDDVRLIEVRDPAAVAPAVGGYRSAKRSTGLEMDMCCSEMCLDDGYEPEQIIMPELIAELFNNDVEIAKSLDLVFEF